MVHGSQVWLGLYPSKNQIFNLPNARPVGYSFSFCSHRDTHTHTHTHCLVPCSIPSLPLPTPLLTPAATSIQLRYDVFVDTIHKIEITTTTRELLLEEAPEMFDVRAFDEEGTRLCVSLSSVHGVLRHGHQCIPIPLIITSGSDTCLVSWLHCGEIYTVVCSLN